MTLTYILLAIVIALAVVIAVLQVVSLARSGRATTGSSDIRGLGAELRTDQAALRQELTGSLAAMSDRQLAAAQQSAQAQAEARATLESRFDDLRTTNETKLEQVRVSVDEKLRLTLKTSLDENASRVERLAKGQAEQQQELQKVLREELEKLRTGNESKLEEMRRTVDEKLQGTLEKRLGESFKLVSERLEQVQKGLGEMQTLASDVGGLKRVLTNVKSRGTWGEVQLARQLEDMMTPEQYAENVAVRPGSAERVEFAIRLPGRDELEAPVWLPIDSKFPQEDYERLVDAQNQDDPGAVEQASRAVERAILAQAKKISEKYVEPPYTTDFAIMYLPTEGLFAEVIRRPGLVTKLQNEYRVSVAGPTVLMTQLNALQLGFRTLAIEQRSSEVWRVLAAAKTEFEKYGEVWDKIGRQLQTVQNTVKEAGTRTRAVTRKLKDVETLELDASGRAADLGLGAFPDGESLVDLDLDPAPPATAAIDERSGDDESHEPVL